MVFNDTSTKLGLIQDCEFWTGLGLSQISGQTNVLAEFVRLINAEYQKATTIIIDAMDDFDFDDSNKTDYPIYTTDLTANRQDYLFPQSLKMLQVKRVEAKMDGSNWYRVNPMDINEDGYATDTASIAYSFAAAKPYYDVQYNALWLYPIPATTVTSGLKIWISREVTEFTASSTTTEPGFDEPFHRMLSIGASMAWCIAKGRPQKGDLMALYTDYEKRLREYYGSKDKDRVYMLKPLAITYT